MRLVLAVLLLVLSAIAAAQDALIFIRPERAGPQIPEEIDPHPIWVEWGPKADNNGLNRLLEPVTGYSWNIPTRDFSLDISHGRPILRAAELWKARGILDARETVLGPEVSVRPLANGAYAPYATPLAATPTGIRLGESSLLIAEASGWDEVAAIAQRHRRTLVLEYPPEGKPYAHAWLFGKAWPTGVPTKGPVLGLWPATEVGMLLRKPDLAKWQEAGKPSQSALSWASARFHTFSLLRLLIAFLALAGFLIGSRALIIERPSLTVNLAVRLALLTPPSAFLAGNLAAIFSPELMPICLPGALMVAVAAERLLHRFTPLHSTWLSVSLVATLCCYPLLPYRTVFFGTPGLAVGVVASSVAGLLAAFPEPPSKWTWVGRTILLLAALGLVQAGCSGVGLVWLLAAGVVATEGWIAGKGKWLAFPILLGLLWGLGANPTFTWNGLLDTIGQADRPNLFLTFQTMTSPFCAILLALGVIGAVFLDGYTRHRLRAAFRHEPRLGGIWQFAALSLPVLTLSPALSAAPLVIFASAGLITLLTALSGG